MIDFLSPALRSTRDGPASFQCRQQAGCFHRCQQLSLMTSSSCTCRFTCTRFAFYNPLLG
ncbi:hypothetical protein PISMIDRAFT_685153, partial [Pisolithus microcarpus 441]